QGQSIAPIPPIDLVMSAEEETQVPTTTTLNSDHPAGSVYGQSVSFTATVSQAFGNSMPSGSVQFQIDGNNYGSTVLLSDGQANIIVTAFAPGQHTISAAYTSDTTTFLDSNSSTSIQVMQAPLTITADNQTKVYGDPLPSLTASYTGFVNGDTPASLTVLPTLTTTTTASSDVVPGGYPITVGGAIDPNYSISYVNGNLTIIPAKQTITWSNPANIIYGTPLGSAQLDATVSVIGPAPAGALIYSPPDGT